VFIEICGYESIISANPGTIVLNQELLGDKRQFEIELSSLFINSSPTNFCPIVRYKITSSSGLVTSPLISQYLTLNSTHLTVDADIQEKVSFALMAETANIKRGWQVFGIDFDPCQF
jgi:hypothetical protein